MLWVAIGLLALAVLAPLTVALERRAPARGAQGLALSLHQAQLRDLRQQSWKCSGGCWRGREAGRPGRRRGRAGRCWR